MGISPCSALFPKLLRDLPLMWISFLTFFVLVIAVIFWFSQMRAREAALTTAKRLCDAKNAQLLDETVHLKRIRLGRSEGGWLGLRREYQFEYSLDGLTRYRGRLILLGAQIVLSRLDALKNDPLNAQTTAQVIPFKKREARND